MKKTILIAAVMFFALSAAAFAQSSFTVSSTPETFVACCGLTEKTGDIAFTAIPGTPDSVTGTLTIIYQVPITATGGISVSAVAGSIGGVVGTAPTLTLPSKTNVDGKGQVVIGIGAGGVAPYTIRLTGVRANVSGSCSGSVSASITSTGNLLTSGETSVTVISNVKNALQNPTVATAASINAVTGDITGGPVISVKENFLDAFGKIAGAAGDPSANISKMIRLTVSAIPAGVSLQFPVQDTSLLFQLAASNGDFLTAPVTINSTTPGPVYYRLVTNSNPTLAESLVVPVTVQVAGNPRPLAAGSISVSAHIAPIDESNTSTVVPRYTGNAECETTAVTFVTISGANTTLLIPYATTVVGFNTGITIANTSLDPGLTAMGFPAAVPQSGTLKFFFYPQTGDPFTYTTKAGSPGSGLSATDGSLAQGRTYIVLLSELLAAAQGPADFNGYVFVIANFTNAHGEYFVSDFSSFTHGALMLVVNRPGTAGRATPESLDN